MMCVSAARVFPNITLREAMWELPFVTLSYLVAQAARRAGVKGVSRPADDRKVWDEWRRTNGKK